MTLAKQKHDTKFNGLMRAISSLLNTLNILNNGKHIQQRLEEIDRGQRKET